MKIFLMNDTRCDRHHGCSIVMGNLLKALGERGATITGSLPCGSRMGDAPGAAAALAQADRVVINGEGTLHHDRPYARYLLETAATQVKAGKQVYLVNASWEANSAEMAALLRGFRGVWVRDSASAAELATHAIDATVVPDLTFLSEYHPAAATGGPLLVSDSVYADTSARLQALAGHLQAHYLPIIQAPALSGTRAAPQKWLKSHVNNAVSALTGYRWKPRQYYVDLRHCITDTGDFLRTLAGSQAMISGRYHATCLALQHRLPLLCCASNTRKVQNLLDDIGMEPGRHICELAELEAMDVGSVLARAAYTTDELARLEAFLDSARNRIANMMDAVTR